MAVGAGLNQGAAAYKFFEGRKQKKKGEKMLDSLQDPNYTIPQEIFENVATSEMMANEGMPAAQKNFYADNIASTQANAIEGFKGRKAGLVGAEVLSEQSNVSNRELLAMDADRRIDNLRYMMDKKNTLADFKNLEFDINVMQPFERNYNYAHALIGAGQQNKVGAVDDYAKSMGSLASGFAAGGA